MRESFASLPAPFLKRRLSGSVVEAEVSFLSSLLLKSFFLVAAHRILRSVFGLETLDGSPRLNEGTVYNEMIIGQKLCSAGLLYDLCQKLSGGVRLDEPLLVGGERRLIQYRFTQGESQKPAEQNIVADLLNQKPVAPDGIQGLKRKTFQQFFRCYRKKTSVGIHSPEFPVKFSKRFVSHGPDGAQRMILRNEGLLRQSNEHGFCDVVIPVYKYILQYQHITCRSMA